MGKLQADIQSGNELSATAVHQLNKKLASIETSLEDVRNGLHQLREEFQQKHMHILLIAKKPGIYG